MSSVVLPGERCMTTVEGKKGDLIVSDYITSSENNSCIRYPHNCQQINVIQTCLCSIHRRNTCRSSINLRNAATGDYSHYELSVISGWYHQKVT